jgi:hypothetical protein
MRAVTTTVVVLSLVLLIVSGGAAQPLSPLVVEWDRFFSVQAQPGVRDGRSVGTIWNTSDWGTRRIQLLVEGLDGNGQAVNQRVMWLGVDLPAGSHAYFEASMPASASYRVRVFAFILETSAGPR